MWFWRCSTVGLLCFTLFSGDCRAEDVPADRNRINPEVAGNADVERILKTFPGRGEVGDDSQPTPAAQAIQQFVLPDDLEIELVATEPVVEQPLFMHFDPRGRLWVVQYRQYPFPEGLKVIHYDQHLRAVFDKVPEPPPHGVKGRDKITVFEDTTGDGVYDTHRDVIEGLNIATSVIVGQGGIWVLNPPYLLFYSDVNNDAVPDADPVVVLSGFGMEDTHSVANSLSWGPDGWIYGANGSTTTGNVSSSATKNVQFEGQCIWRYHPKSTVFEIYAEGGGNTFSTELDLEGRVFSGTNHGNTRGMFYPQGSYGTKNWGKHGPLTNPYAFGYFEHMPHQGDTDRFAQTFVIYEGGTLPQRYQHTVIAANALHNRVWASSLSPLGSTYQTADLPPIVTTPDRWFRPVDVKVGPDGAVYLADWYDTRLTHVDPRDNWHKTSGRIYRIQSKAAVAETRPEQHDFDFTKLSDEQLIERFRVNNKWQRQTAVRVLGDRHRDASLPERTALIRKLSSLLDSADGDAPALEALWVLNLLGELTDAQRESTLHHANLDVRRWSLRLLGDQRAATPQMISAMTRLAAQEQDLHVLSQLASTLRRLPAVLAMQVLPTLLARDDVQQDPHLPLLMWWAVEAHCGGDAAELSPQVAVKIPATISQPASPRQQLLTLWEQPEAWHTQAAEQMILRRLMQRFALESVLETEQGTTADSNTDSTTDSSLTACVRLFELAPSKAHSEILMAGFIEAYEGRPIDQLPPTLAKAIQEYQRTIGSSDLVLGLKLGDEQAIQDALKFVSNESANSAQRLTCIELLGQAKRPEVVPTLLGLLGSSAPGIKRLALSALMNYDDPGIGANICNRWQSTITAEHNLRATALQVLASRPVWTKQLLAEVTEFRIKSDEVPLDIVQQMRLHSDVEIQQMLNKYWGQTRSTPEEKQQQIARIRVLLTTSAEPPPDARVGQELFKKHCAVCHTLFNSGGQTGPNLTGYERDNLNFMLLAMVDPSAAIREEFTQYQVALRDGRILTGLIDTQTPTVLTLRGANNQVTTMNKADVELLQAMNTSLMPDGLLEKLTPEEIRHLFSFLVRRTPLAE